MWLECGRGGGGGQRGGGKLHWVSRAPNMEGTCFKKIYTYVARGLDRGLWCENKSKETGPETMSITRWENVLFPPQNQHV